MCDIDLAFRKYAEKMYPKIKRKLERQFDQIHSNGTHKIQQLPDDASILYTPLHKSHLDYIILLADTFRQNLPFPRIVSGNNLLQGVTGAVIRYAANLDFAALGTLGIPRSLAQNASEEEKQKHEEESKVFQEEFTSGLEKGVLAIYPEAKEIDGAEKKTGRSYTGKERTFSPIFARDAVKQDKLYVIPMAVTYDWIAETHLFEKLRNAKANGNNTVYQALEAKSFIWDLWRGGHGNVYINYGEPIKASDMRASQLVKEAQKRAYECVHPTEIMISSYLIRSRFNEGEENSDLSMMLLGPKRERELAQKGVLEETDFALRGRAYTKATNFLVKKGVLSRQKRGRLAIQKPEIIDLYANQIAHFYKN